MYIQYIHYDGAMILEYYFHYKFENTMDVSMFGNCVNVTS